MLRRDIFTKEIRRLLHGGGSNPECAGKECQCEKRKSLQEPLEPGRDWLVQLHSLATCECRHMTEGRSQVVVVENQDAGQFADGGCEVGEGAGKAFNQLIRWHIMPPLGNPHANTLFRCVDV